MINPSGERTFTPGEFALFCQSPLAAWWVELDRRKLFKGQKPKPDPLSEILKKDFILEKNICYSSILLKRL